MNSLISAGLAAALCAAAGAQVTTPPVDAPAVLELSVSLDTGSATVLTAGEIQVLSFTGSSSASITMTAGELSVVSGRGTGEVSAPCRVDFNGDGFVDFFDYDAFVAAFEAGDPSADYAADGFVDFFDLDSFVADMEVGC